MKKRICDYDEWLSDEPRDAGCIAEAGRVCTIGESWASCAYGQIALGEFPEKLVQFPGPELEKR